MSHIVPNANHDGYVGCNTPVNQVDIDRLLELLTASPGQDQHRACGVSARPCKDCRHTAPLPCVDPESCGVTDFCRPCCATWRCRIWRLHLRHVREYHAACERFPALLELHHEPAVAAAIWYELRRALRRDVRRMVRSLLARELPPAVQHLMGRAG
jgi:hypothetical protein